MLAEKARIGPEDHVLEVGCGWGGFALFAAATYGCRVTGITVSERQYSRARARVAAAGLEHRIEVRLQDYRDVTGSFDKIVSIEMFEALGREHWPVFFAKLDDLLAPHGLVALQTISVPDHRFEEYARHCDWIQKHIFPGSMLASLHHVTGAMSRVSRLGVHHLEDIGDHYALTLARWREAYLSKLDQVRGLGFDERFIRMWDYYLAACQAYFATRRLGDLQLVLPAPATRGSRGFPCADRPRPEGNVTWIDRIVERDLLPDPVLRLGIRWLVRERARREGEGGVEAQQARLMDWVRTLRESPIAIETEAANEQHYEVPAAFFALVLGRASQVLLRPLAGGRHHASTLAEEAMLALTGERAGLADGQRILELGCGWGSLIAVDGRALPGTPRSPRCPTRAPQRAFIEAQARAARARQHHRDHRRHERASRRRQRFDRVVSVEMFEHMRNYEALLAGSRRWLVPGGRLFVHIFAIARCAYPYEDRGAGDWMARHFFTGGQMPSHDLLLYFQRRPPAIEHWRVRPHYAATAEAWVRNMDRIRNADAAGLLRETLRRRRGAQRWWARWRIFFLACAELWAWRGGQEWLVTHLLFEKPTA